MKRTAVVCFVLVFAVGAVGAADLKASAVRVGTQADVVYQKQQIQRLHSRLMEQQIDLGVKNPLVVSLTEDQRNSIYSAANELPMRVGVVAPVKATVRFDDRATKEASLQPYGATRLVDDSMVWTMAVISEGATGIRLHITGLDLPEGAELAIYNKRGEAFAYTGRGPSDSGDFWTHTMTGSVATLQLTGAEITDVSFTIADLGYLGDNWAAGLKKRPSPTGDSNLCGYNADCVENAGCTTSDEVAAATQAVAHMQFVEDPYLYICSGGLISNASGAPYFLTANHCMSTNTVASSLEAYFFYEIGCDDSCLPQWTAPSTPRTLGATVAATNETGDYTLLLLGDDAPSGTVMLGWDATDISRANGTMLYRISHPLSAPQAYSTHSVNDAWACSSWPIGSWIYSQDVIGATQGGSSGSPVVNGNGEIVGQLSGSCGSNLNDECDVINNHTVDGAFASYYNEISGLLGTACVPEPEDCSNGEDDDCDGLADGNDPDCIEPCTDFDEDGWCPEDGDCDDTAAWINPGEDEVCDDGIDNDCDGDTDGDDTDCVTCSARGVPCTTNAECCSGSCHPRKLTCK